MKKLLTLALALVLVLSMTVASAEVVFQLDETHFEGYPTTMADYEFAPPLVEERTEGRVKIEVYSGSVLADSEPPRSRCCRLVPWASPAFPLPRLRPMFRR